MLAADQLEGKSEREMMNLKRFACSIFRLLSGEPVAAGWAGERGQSDRFLLVLFVFS